MSVETDNLTLELFPYRSILNVNGEQEITNCEVEHLVELRTEMS
uniref:Uncharacterized protein n=1 Tax=Nelumbo nucifera TaxID=4432 RepID=A0A822YQ06_NELNU|nr:TPA_asm: hypothetical protein HUJ06_005300 [Nelumbo nucifera]